MIERVNVVSVPAAHRPGHPRGELHLVQAVPVPRDRPGPPLPAALQRLQAAQAARHLPGSSQLHAHQAEPPRSAGQTTEAADTSEISLFEVRLEKAPTCDKGNNAGARSKMWPYHFSFLPDTCPFVSFWLFQPEDQVMGAVEVKLKALFLTAKHLVHGSVSHLCVFPPPTDPEYFIPSSSRDVTQGTRQSCCNGNSHSDSTMCLL